MRYRYIITALMLLSMLNASAQQFDPNLASKSLVRVVVSVNQKESNVLTGFIWKNPNQVVTSLHGMSRTGTIKILYPGNAWRNAIIKKLLPKADLVLLELAPGEQAPPAAATPISNINSGSIKFGAEVFALGFNSGAQGSSSRTLKKGFVEPEILDNLIPKKDKTALEKLGFPALDLNILYLEGSLLPGYSGAPIFDSQGRLIGVGNGGLEKGASNVSWIIPAKYLNELEISSIMSLPANFEQLSQLFSAGVTIDGSTDNMPSVEKSLFQPDQSRPIQANDFEFYFTKNRSLMEMVDTSDDPENLLKLSKEMSVDININLNYEKMKFDIYEDIFNGVVLAVPEGHDLIYNQAEEAFEVVGEQQNDLKLYYAGLKDDFSATNFEEVLYAVSNYVSSNIAVRYGLSGFTYDEDYSDMQSFGDNRQIAWILSSGNEPLVGNDGLTYVMFLYITILMSSDKTFMSIATIPIPAEFIMLTRNYGLDCNNPGMFGEQCGYFNNVFKTFSAAHLTTFAY